MRSSAIVSFLAVIALTACGGGEDLKPLIAPPSGSNSDSPGSNTSAPPVVGVPNNSSDPGCPWNFGTSEISQKYEAAGINLFVDCEQLFPSTRFGGYHYSQADFDATMAALDQALPTITASRTNLARVVIGKRSLHRTKDSLIQLPMSGQGAPLNRVEQFFSSTLALMDAEEKIFNGEVRLNYRQIEKTRNANGEIVDVGTLWLPAPNQSDVDADLVNARALKKEILAHKSLFPDVIFEHGNGLSFYEVDQRNGSYKLPSNGNLAEIRGFFKYLGAYEDTIAKYAPVAVDVPAYRELSRGFKPDFDRSVKLLKLVNELADNLKSKLGMRMVRFQPQGSNGSSINTDVIVHWNNGVLNISGLVNMFGESPNAKQILDCVEAQDFRKESFHAKCRRR